MASLKLFAVFIFWLAIENVDVDIIQVPRLAVNISKIEEARCFCLISIIHRQIYQDFTLLFLEPWIQHLRVGRYIFYIRKFRNNFWIL